MPRVFEQDGYKYFFFANEGSPREPVHIHVRKAEKTAKFWLDPEITLAYSYEMRASELRRLQEVIKERSNLIREKWNEYFGS